MPLLIRSLIGLSAAIALASCSSGVGDALDTRQNVGPCPPAGSIYEAARMIAFDGSETYSDIAWTGEITGVKLFCRYVGTDPITADIDIDFALGKGEAASGDSHRYDYFVSVIRRGGTVLARQSYSVDVEFGKVPVAAVHERVSVEIPRADETISGVNFEILVGFVLTEEQLAFNRAGKRFRLDARQ